VPNWGWATTIWITSRCRKSAWGEKGLMSLNN
jgi:hypothetical protein